MKNLLLKNKTIIVIALAPLLLIVDFILFTKTTELLRAASDRSVVLGALLLCIMISANLLLLKLISTIFKNQK